MTVAKRAHTRQIVGLVLLILVQSFCAVVFLGDVVKDASGARGFSLQLSIELVAGAALGIAIFIEAGVILAMQRRQERSERSMQAARGAFHDLIEAYFQSWQLSPAERDVAGFLIKGCSISEISHLRNAAEGTVKTQLNSVYRKAGVTGRSQLVSLLIEDLMVEPLTGPDGAANAAPAG